MPPPRLLAVAALVALSACARTELAHTQGEIPRDANGKPMWSLITPSGTAPAPAR